MLDRAWKPVKSTAGQSTATTQLPPPNCHNTTANNQLPSQVLERVKEPLKSLIGRDDPAIAYPVLSHVLLLAQVRLRSLALTWDPVRLDILVLSVGGKVLADLALA